MSNTPENWMRKINVFDLFFSCEPCSMMIERWQTRRNVVRWHCDDCCKYFVPFFDELLVADDPYPYPENEE